MPRRISTNCQLSAPTTRPIGSIESQQGPSRLPRTQNSMCRTRAISDAQLTRVAALSSQSSHLYTTRCAAAAITTLAEWRNTPSPHLAEWRVQMRSVRTRFEFSLLLELLLARLLLSLMPLLPLLPFARLCLPPRPPVCSSSGDGDGRFLALDKGLLAHLQGLRPPPSAVARPPPSDHRTYGTLRLRPLLACEVLGLGHVRVCR